MQSDGRAVIRNGGVNDIVEIAEVALSRLARDFDSRYPPLGTAARLVTNSLVARLVVAPSSTIAPALRRRRHAQVGTSIVERVVVLMVDHFSSLQRSPYHQ